jgi:hypothetical protein
MAKNALPAISDDDEIDEDILTDTLLQGSKNLPSLSAKRAEPAKGSGKPAIKEDPGRQRITKAISLPTYVWDWIKAEHRAKDEPQNVVIMRMMKQGGAPIREEDLIDGRISRLAHGRRS